MQGDKKRQAAFWAHIDHSLKGNSQLKAGVGAHTDVVQVLANCRDCRHCHDCHLTTCVLCAQRWLKPDDWAKEMPQQQQASHLVCMHICMMFVCVGRSSSRSCSSSSSSGSRLVDCA